MKTNTRIALGTGIAAIALLVYYRQKKQQAALLLPSNISPTANQATVSSIGSAIGGLFTNIADLLTFQGNGVSTGNTPLPASINTGGNLGTVVSPQSLSTTFTATNNDTTLITDAEGYLWGRIGAANGDNTLWYNSLLGTLTSAQLDSRL